ncbi:MAG: 1-deoxy-D-xylulose-5-phosphate synthase [Candidatus Saccharibacteria bacterium]
MSTLLETINKPEDLKTLTPAQLEKLGAEIRELLVNTVAHNGGHLAANLGIVELTMALHYIYDSPKDKIIWDVGHQSYVHKILTGRKDNIETLRQYKGLSGFPKREESPYDAFGTGHASTSISAAVGLALGRDLARESHSVVAVIGDGALTGGMAYEAMNHAGHLGLDMTVILNDNEMSISKNVGAMSTYLSKLRSDPGYTKRKEDVESLLNKIPKIGQDILKLATKVKDTVKFMMVPGMLFEELGFTYYGPIDGHNLTDLIEVLKKARHKKGPVLIHVITQKGQGYGPAFESPDEFHGIGPFDVETGQQLKGQSRTFTQVFGDFMVRKGADEPRLVGITAAMESGTGLTQFARMYPKRFIDVGICEQHAVTMAAGLAAAGMKPVVALYSSFLQRAFDQVIHDVCLQKLPVIFAVDRAGLVGEDGPTHHGVFDMSFLREIPNLIVMAPSNEDELNDMLDSALQYDQPVAIRYPRGTGSGSAIKINPAYVEVGRGELIQEGEQILFVGIGRGVGIASRAAELLSKQGVSAAVINSRFVKPLDERLITHWAAVCKRVVTVEDNVLAGGFGSAVMELLNNRGVKADVLRMGIADEFVEHGKVDKLLVDQGIEPVSINEQVVRRWPDLRMARVSSGS